MRTLTATTAIEDMLRDRVSYIEKRMMDANQLPHEAVRRSGEFCPELDEAESVDGEDKIGVSEEGRLVRCRFESDDKEVPQEPPEYEGDAEDGWADMHERANGVEGDVRPGARSRAGARLRTSRAWEIEKFNGEFVMRKLRRIPETHEGSKLALKFVSNKVEYWTVDDDEKLFPHEAVWTGR